MNDDRIFIGTNRVVLVFLTKTGKLLIRHMIPDVYGKIYSHYLGLDMLLCLVPTRIPESNEFTILCKKAESRIACLIKVSKRRKENSVETIIFTEETTHDLRAKISSD